MEGVQSVIHGHGAEEAVPDRDCFFTIWTKKNENFHFDAPLR